MYTRCISIYFLLLQYLEMIGNYVALAVHIGNILTETDADDPHPPPNPPTKRCISIHIDMQL